jgi:predicted hotdog family 3-hydroxylacyl-ACP dehydratase
MLSHEQIAKLIPHSGTMCLLGTVQQFDETQITCTAQSHRDALNPLRSGDQLSSACGVEYAAQAMAVHGALLSQQDPGAAPRPGMLASMRNVVLHQATLHEVMGDLTITATRLMGDGNNMVYEFIVSAAEKCLVTGRATVVLSAQERTI